MKVVIVCHEFTRMQRMRSLAEGLTAEGHDVVYATSETECVEDRYPIACVPYVSLGARAKRVVRVDDQASLAEVARSRGALLERVTRLAARTYEAAFLYPDKYRGWIPAVREWLQGCPESLRDADVVIASMMPVTALTAGRLVADHLDVPLVVDFRDLWTDNAQYGLGPLRRMIDRISERRILADAAAVTTVTGHLQRELSPRVPGETVHLIHTGVDPAPWTAAARTPDGLLRFGHVGVWMGGRRTIRPLLDSLQRLASADRIDLTRVRVDMWGEIDEKVLRDAEETGTKDVVEYHGRIAMHDVPSALSTVDVALVPTWPQDVWSIPLKTFQYLAGGKTILFIDATRGSEMLRLVEGLPGIDVNDTPQQLDEHIARYYDTVTAGGVLDWSVDERPVPVTSATMARQFLEVVQAVVR